MVTRAKNRKKAFKRHLRGQWQDFKIISRQCSSYAPLPKLLKSALLNEMIARAINRKKKKKKKKKKKNPLKDKISR